MRIEDSIARLVWRNDRGRIPAQFHILSDVRHKTNFDFGWRGKEEPRMQGHV